MWHEVVRYDFVPIFDLHLRNARGLNGRTGGVFPPSHSRMHFSWKYAPCEHVIFGTFFGRKWYKLSAVVRDQGRTWTMTRNNLAWLHPRTCFGRVIGDWKRFNILCQVFNKSEELFISSRRCWIWASYIHRSDFEGNFGLLYIAKWGNYFPVLFPSLARVALSYVLLYGFPHFRLPVI